MKRINSSIAALGWVSPTAAAAAETSTEHPPGQSLWSDAFVFWSLVVSAVALAWLLNSQMELRWQTSVLQSQTRELDQRSLEEAHLLEDAVPAQAHFDAFRTGVVRVVAVGDRKGWTSLLRSLAIGAQRGLSLDGILVREDPEGSGTYTVQLSGQASGLHPRAIADQFLSRFRADLTQNLKVLDPVHFEELADSAAAAETVRFRITTRMAPRTSPQP